MILHLLTDLGLVRLKKQGSEIKPIAHYEKIVIEVPTLISKPAVVAVLSALKERDITDAIPKTYVLSKNNLAQNLNWLEKDQTMLKPGDLARGEGILFGKVKGISSRVSDLKQ